MTSNREIENLSINNLEIVMVSDCFGDKRIIEVLLPEGLAVEDLDRLSGVGSKTILQDLPQPFFRIDCPGRFLLTGIVGNPKLRFTMRRSLRTQSRHIVLKAVCELSGILKITEKNL